MARYGPLWLAMAPLWPCYGLAIGTLWEMHYEATREKGDRWLLRNTNTDGSNNQNTVYVLELLAEYVETHGTSRR